MFPDHLFYIFTAGCFHGKPVCPLCNFPFAVTFSDSNSASIDRGFPIHPTQLYEAIGNFALVLVLLA